MSDKTVAQLAQQVKMPLDILVMQLKKVGINACDPEDIIDGDEAVKLLTAYLRKKHGKDDGTKSPKKITLNQRKTTTLQQVTMQGATPKSVSVKVLKKRTYTRHSDLKTTTEQPAPDPIKQIAEKEQQKNEQSSKETSPATSDAKDNKNKSTDETTKKTTVAQSTQTISPDTAQPVTQKEHNIDDNLSKEERESKKQEEAKKIHLESSIEKNAAKVRKQAEAKKQKTLHKTEQGTSATNRNKGTVAARPVTTTKKRGIAPGRGRTMPTGTGRRIKGKKGKQKKIEIAVNLDAQHQFQKPDEVIVRDVNIPEVIVVSQLAQKMSVKVGDVIKELMKLGVMATINQTIDQETSAILVEEMGHRPILQNDDDLEKEMLAEVIDLATDDNRQTLPRAPIVTIMGHVDHGKTSLLDFIRTTRVASSEAGGITQHIGAYQVKTDHGNVTFLDTPGHSAFTAMRLRGAQITDIVIVVVAADDGVMPQTKEAVEHAKVAGVPLIVAINKMDKAEANPDQVMQEMSTLEVVPEEWGGDTQFLKVSAKTGEGIDTLIEALILQTEILELQAPFEGAASGFVIESRLDIGRGAVATILVQKGNLKKGQIVLCGHEYGRIKAMFDENGKAIEAAGPSTPVEILGLSGTPEAGDEFVFASNEKVAKELAKHREHRKIAIKHATQQASKLDEIFSKMTAGDTATLNIVIKTDVQGSLEALRDALIQLSNDEVGVKCIYGGVGGINEGDANLALASDAILIGFNVRADATARKLIRNKGIDLHYYSVIFEAIAEVKQALSGMLAPAIQEKAVGLAEVREVFKSPKLGAIAGCMVISGVVKRHLPIRILRENVVILERELESLRRFKEDVNEVKMGMECGISVKNYTDVKAGDQIEVFERIEVRREL